MIVFLFYAQKDFLASEIICKPLIALKKGRMGRGGGEKNKKSSTQNDLLSLLFKHFIFVHKATLNS